MHGSERQSYNKLKKTHFTESVLNVSNNLHTASPNPGEKGGLWKVDGQYKTQLFNMN
jgi:hypothetical protein